MKPLDIKMIKEALLHEEQQEMIQEMSIENSKDIPPFTFDLLSSSNQDPMKSRIMSKSF